MKHDHGPLQSKTNIQFELNSISKTLIYNYAYIYLSQYDIAWLISHNPKHSVQSDNQRNSCQAAHYSTKQIL